MTIQRQIEELGGKGNDFKPISLTGQVNDAIINRNGIEVSPELLDTLVREVQVYPDNKVETEWEFW